MEDAIYSLCEQISSLATTLETALEKNNETLKKIHRELLISNLPQDLRNDQRHYFQLEENLDFNIENQYRYEKKLDKAKKEGNKEEIEKYEGVYKASVDGVKKTLKGLSDL